VFCAVLNVRGCKTQNNISKNEIIENEIKVDKNNKNNENNENKNENNEIKGDENV